MPKSEKLKRPWLIAAWPGMGHVAVNAAVYLLAKLDMTLTAEFSANDLFDVDHVEVKDGVLKLGRRPRSRFFVWRNLEKDHDLVIFLGEAQPPIGGYSFCGKLLDYARNLGVERVFTFAAMGTQMRPEQDCRVFVTATNERLLKDLQSLQLEVLANGKVSGLNGVLLGVSKEMDLEGACLLGEMPGIFSQFPFPKASLSILEVFTKMAGIQLDLSELKQQAVTVEQHLSELLVRLEETHGSRHGEDEEQWAPEPEEEQGPSPADRQRIEKLFEEAARDRSKAFELKRELDRLEAFKEYEDRFLDLFKSTS
jgi:proteasome assembly chaperone (PAC2) family protein